tara:strand:- start:75 stop:1064 length:990 start_codon:yes stop_codon:yes gene_type:complete
MNIGVIGYKGHSKKIIDHISKDNSLKLIVFCRKIETSNKLNLSNNIKNITYSSELKSLDDCEAVIISSSNESHLHYIKYFLTKNTFILCEKPACIDLEEYNFLKNLSSDQKKRIYFNFNLKKSILFDLISSMLRKNNYGNLFHISISMSYGIAFKSNFQNNWRSKKDNIFQTIAGNLGIHYINLIEHFFGKTSNIFINFSSVANENFIDTSNININFKKNISSSIFLSYASPYSNLITLYFTDAIIEINNGLVREFSPRDTYDKKGLFKSPNEKIIEKIPKDFINKSLENSLDYFILKVKNNDEFSINDFNQNIESSLTLINSNYFGYK